MDALMAIAKRHGLRVIEDCAQATGATYRGMKLGTIGDIGCFSFFPTKNLGAIGDGGAISCNDTAIADRLRSLRQYGWDNNRVSLEPGINSRLDELQAAVLQVKLRYLDVDNAQRQLQAEMYCKELEYLSLKCPTKRNNSTHVYHLYVVQAEKRDALIFHLKEKKVMAGVHYPMPVHHMPGFLSDVRLPVTEYLSEHVLSLPLFPGLLEKKIKEIVVSVREWDSSQNENATCCV